jgi:hypothetical protein
LRGGVSATIHVAMIAGRRVTASPHQTPVARVPHIHRAVNVSAHKQLLITFQIDDHFGVHLELPDRDQRLEQAPYKYAIGEVVTRGDRVVVDELESGDHVRAAALVYELTRLQKPHLDEERLLLGLLDRADNEYAIEIDLDRSRARYLGSYTALQRHIAHVPHLDVVGEEDEQEPLVYFVVDDFYVLDRVMGQVQVGPVLQQTRLVLDMVDLELAFTFIDDYFSLIKLINIFQVTLIG